VTRRGRIVAAVSAVALAALATALWALPRVIERRVAASLTRQAARRGLRLRIGQIRFRWLSPLVLHDLRLEGARGVADVTEVEVRWRPARGPRTAWVKGVAARGVRILLPDRLVIAAAEEDWDVLDLSARSARLARHAGRGRIAGALSDGGRAELVFSDLDLGRLRITRAGAPLADPGRCDGRLDVGAEPGQPVRVDGVVRSAGVRFAGLSAGASSGGGAPTSLEVAFTVELDPAAGRARVDCARAVSNGVEVALEGTLLEGGDDVWFDVALDVKRVELAPLLLAAGLDLPQKVATPSGDLGSVALVARLLGQLSDPASIAVEEKLSFVPPREAIPALEALKGPFSHTARLAGGTSCTIEVAEGSPDYVVLDDVPPLFLRALTISEDAGFWGHRGIDLREIPVAWATNRLRGTPSRGASTITQQLAKNLFLTREKSYGRKLQELALTFLLESTLGKRRILELYLNVIEWGPALHGLRPACRTYFGKEPRDLSVKEMAYLVCLIPSPVRYQTSFEKGQLTPGFAPLVTNLLAKLRSVDAITEEEYLAAREEPMAFAR